LSYWFFSLAGSLATRKLPATMRKEPSHQESDKDSPRKIELAVAVNNKLAAVLTKLASAEVGEACRALEKTATIQALLARVKTTSSPLNGRRRDGETEESCSWSSPSLATKPEVAPRAPAARDSRTPLLATIY